MVAAILGAFILWPLNILTRLILIILGLIVVPVAVTIAQLSNSDKLLSIFWLWDNEEDGYTGNKTGWYDRYLGGEVSGIKRWLRSVNWSMLRNPVNNAQRAPLLSWKTANPDKIIIKKLKGVDRWLMMIKPEGAFFWHLGASFKIGKFGFKVGALQYPWYYEAYWGEPIPIPKANERFTYTFRLANY